MNYNTGECNYKELAQKRDEITSAIINSEASNKLTIAGPGTGKSYLFQQICKRKCAEGKTNILALSFINELVDDLARDLSRLAEVKTLHSFALGKLPGNNKMFFELGKVIERDYAINFKAKVDYNNIFCNLINAEEELKFYSERRRYYNHFSPNCSVYALIKLFEADEHRIPEYTQILIDEYQDFNKLESRLLFFLSNKSPVVIVGDDDQSLYDFKYAEPGEIRSKYSSDDYETFELPYCSRCTKVVIDAFGNVIETATSKGYLQERASKDFLYFPSKEKDRISTKHSRIILKRNVYPGVLAYNIDRDIQELFDPNEDQMPTVLIVCPLRQHIKQVEKGLRALGYNNIDASEKDVYDEVVEGFILLQKDSSCNLAWRILFEAECNRNGVSGRFEQVMKENIESDTPFKDLLSVDERRIIKNVNASLRKIKSQEEVDEDRMNEVFTVLGYNPIEITRAKIRKKLLQKTAKRNIYKNTAIKIVTILGSKGLTKDYTFLVNFDDRFLLERNNKGELTITDVSICKFLVTLTRARERVSIYTGVEDIPTYMRWINDEFIDDQT